MAVLDDVKKALRVTHEEDDDFLTRLINSATREYFAYVNPDELPTDPAIESSSETPDAEAFVPEDAFNGIVLMVQADYDGDPLQREVLRRAAETLWTPYRQHMGM